ncbi:MAG: dTDP-glucose 4,6-dehydratase [Candidatus Omnitrophica bacterium]|nr:dTDP-glucose 4,6-dehydratase [Candidatus Omnitrophota bacterium]
MRAGIPKILVTGGAGFIGSAFVRLAARCGYRMIICDKLTYAGDLSRLKEAAGSYKFYRADICNPLTIGRIIKKEIPDGIINFAAETHVDRSIAGCAPFLKTNILGTQVLLDLSKKFKIKRFVQLSTDEVYGEIKNGQFTENSELKPNSPYAASKASADLLIRAYIRTYGFPGIIVRPCNNYGPWQYPEKLIPLGIACAIKGRKIPVYGRGINTREWLYVDDCARGILEVFRKGKPGEAYNLGSAEEKINLEVVRGILGLTGNDQRMFEFVKDRPGHDIRYKLDSEKLRRLTGWKPEINFTRGLKLTVEWNLRNQRWLLRKHHAEK